MDSKNISNQVLFTIDAYQDFQPITPAIPYLLDNAINGIGVKSIVGIKLFNDIFEGSYSNSNPIVKVKSKLLNYIELHEVLCNYQQEIPDNHSRLFYITAIFNDGTQHKINRNMTKTSDKSFKTFVNEIYGEMIKFKQVGANYIPKAKEVGLKKLYEALNPQRLFVMFTQCDELTFNTIEELEERLNKYMMVETKAKSIKVLVTIPEINEPYEFFCYIHKNNPTNLKRYVYSCLEQDRDSLKSRSYYEEAEWHNKAMIAVKKNWLSIDDENQPKKSLLTTEAAREIVKMIEQFEEQEKALSRIVEDKPNDSKHQQFFIMGEDIGTLQSFNTIEDLESALIAEARKQIDTVLIGTWAEEITVTIPEINFIHKTTCFIDINNGKLYCHNTSIFFNLKYWILRQIKEEINWRTLDLRWRKNDEANDARIKTLKDAVKMISKHWMNDINTLPSAKLSLSNENQINQDVDYKILYQNWIIKLVNQCRFDEIKSYSEWLEIAETVL